MMKVCADPTVPPAVMAVGIREVSWNVTGRFRLSPTLNCWLTSKPEVNCRNQAIALIGDFALRGNEQNGLMESRLAYRP